MITSIEDIRGVAAPEIVELSGWTSEDVFVCKLRKTGIFEMQMKGDIPDPVLKIIQKMLSKVTYEKKAYPEFGQQTAQAFYYVARSCLADPTLEDLEDADVHLTDMQLTEIFAYRVGGFPMLRKYRDSLKPRDTKAMKENGGETL